MSLFALLALGAVFVKLASEMREGDTSGFDDAILGWFRDPHSTTGLVGPVWLAEAARDFTSLGGYAILTAIVVLVLAYLLLVRKRFEALHIAFAVVSGTILSNLLKIGFNRPRPVFAQAQAVFTASFPSGHATMSAVVFLTLGAILALHEPRPSLKAFYLATAVALTLVVGLTRLYLGVHYPTDVIAGWCLGAGWAILWVLAAYAVHRWLVARDAFVDLESL